MAGTLEIFCETHFKVSTQVSDSRVYSRLLPQTWLILLAFQNLLLIIVRRGFVLNVLEGNCQSQGLDEGHENCIKDVKASYVF